MPHDVIHIIAQRDRLLVELAKRDGISEEAARTKFLGGTHD